MEQLGAWSLPERVEMLLESALELVGTHCLETTPQRITGVLSLISDLRFPRSARRLARSVWQPEGQGFESLGSTEKPRSDGSSSNK